MLSLVKEITSIYKAYFNIDSQNINPNTNLCKSCKGICCKQCGCYFSPYDFTDLSFEYLKNRLDIGYISIDNISSRFTGLRNDYLILRTRNKNRNIYDIDITRQTLGCDLLTSEGCLLTYDERPSGGKLLIPKKYSTCESEYTITDCALEWKQYQSVLLHLASHYQWTETQHHYENQLVKTRKINRN